MSGIEVSETPAVTDPTSWLSSARNAAVKDTPPRGILKISSTLTEAQERQENGNNRDGNADQCSPACTPPSGILKRRRPLFADGTEGNNEQGKASPTSAQRRVHFCTEELSCLSDEEGEQSRNSPRKRFRSAQGTVTAAPRQVSLTPAPGFSNRFLMRTIRMVQQVTNGAAVDVNNSPCNNDAASMTAVSSQPYQPDNQRPFYPALIDCAESIETIVHQLVPSTKFRAVMIFLKARNITTIGRLASMTEYQVHHLPVKTPRVETVRKALQQYEKDVLVPEAGETSEGTESSENGVTVEKLVSSSDPSKEHHEPELQRRNVSEPGVENVSIIPAIESENDGSASPLIISTAAPPTNADLTTPISPGVEESKTDRSASASPLIISTAAPPTNSDLTTPTIPGVEESETNRSASPLIISTAATPAMNTDLTSPMITVIESETVRSASPLIISTASPPAINANSTSSIIPGIESNTDRSASPPIISTDALTTTSANPATDFDINRSISPVILFENITPRKVPSTGVGPISSPVLISEDVICQTDTRDPREVSSELLHSLSVETMERMSIQDLRKMSNDLMACLKIVFDHLNRSE